MADLNQLFTPALAEPFAVVGSDGIEGALADAVQAPLCVSVLRELVAPLQVPASASRWTAPPRRRS